MFEKFKGYYNNGLWNIDKIWNVVEKGAITEVEYQEITGFVYPNKA